MNLQCRETCYENQNSLDKVVPVKTYDVMQVLDAGK